MKKTWSLSTTVRNPERILPFLRTLQEMEGESFNEQGQVKFQVLLIQNRLYRPMGLTDELAEHYETLNDKMSFQQARDIFNFMKNKSSVLRTDEGLRGRTSVAPLTKMGLAIAKKSSGVVKVTDLGKAFLKKQIDIGDVYFRFFIKWQIPNPESNDYKLEDGYDIKPFIGVLHLVHAVNQKEISRGNSPKGINKKEFSLFATTLIEYKNINAYAEKIIDLRVQLLGKTKQEQKNVFDNYKKQFASEFLGSTNQNDITSLLKNLQDYGDNAIRYFYLTRYIYIRGGGFYIDLEPRRAVEIESLLRFDNAQSRYFKSKKEYLNYISDISQPKLPWETKEKYIESIEKLIKEIKFYKTVLPKQKIEIKNYKKMQEAGLKKYISELRTDRRLLQEQTNYIKAQGVEEIKLYIDNFENIFDFDGRPILLEKLTTLGLHALNDALKIQPNYPVGDDNEPTFTAPANTPDIECFYEGFNAICEVTMLTSRDQWYNEGQPVMRHLRDFENKYPNKTSYCLFIAPKLHRDTVNTFWPAIKHEYEGRPQKIVPLSISNFVSILKILVQAKEGNNFLKHSEISRLYDEILDSANSFTDSTQWVQSIPDTISSWREGLSF